MGLLGNAIVSLCVSVGSQYQPACNSALTATAKQTGFETQADAAQKKGEVEATKFGENLIPPEERPYVGGFVFLAKTAVDRKLAVPLGGLGICDQMRTELKPDSAILYLKWNF